MTGATVAAEEFPAIETPAGPLRPEQRLVAPDIIRGIAVFGLVWVNFNDPATSVLDRAARWVMVVFAAGKFYTLFSVLFGVTLAMQLDRAEMRGDRFGWRWVRRMAVLYVIGWLNAVFMWGGDILREYAVAGVALLLFARRSDRTVLVAAAALTLMALPRESLSVQAVRLTRGDVAAAKAHAQALPMARIGPFRDALEHGTFGDVVRTRVDMITALAEHRGTQPPAGPLNLFPLTFLALFLVGSGRAGIRSFRDRTNTSASCGAWRSWVACSA